jgi:putative endonuclease
MYGHSCAVANIKSSHNINLGRFGEEKVARYLAERRYEILDRNWRCQSGEIDLIAKSPAGTIVFIEVKTRMNNSFGHPLESIDSIKQGRLTRLARNWLRVNKFGAREYRIDCVAVTLAPELKIDYRIGVI